VPEEKAASRKAEAVFLALACLVGLGTGALGTLFHLLVAALLAWPGLLVDRFGSGPGVVVAAAVIAAGLALVSAMIVRRYAPEAAGSGVQEIEGTLAGLRPLRWRRVLPVKFVAGTLALSSGMVLGREGPTIHIGASIAGAVAEWGRLGKVERRGLIAAGAAAGLTAAFNAPLASVLFVIEETRRQFPYSFKTYVGVIVACVLSAVVTERIAGVGADLPISVQAMPLWLLAGFAVLGVVIGGLGVLFNFMLLKGLDLAEAIHKRFHHGFAIAVGLVIGALLILLPEATQGDEHLVLKLIADRHTVMFLVGLVVLRLFTSVASYTSGVPGGIFAPILTLAAAVGLALGGIVGIFLPESEPVAVAFAVAAMGGLFTSSVRAPLVGVVLVLELTGAFEIVLPVLLTCGVAHLTAEWLGGRPIYSQLLERTLARAGTATSVPGRHQDT
jgi:CIC family chloride channel protein